MDTECTCGGIGWIVKPDEGVGSAHPCPCRSEPLSPQQVADALRAAGVGRRELQAATQPWKAIYGSQEVTTALVEELPAWAKAVASIRDDRPVEPWLWLLEGEVGVGKTRAGIRSGLAVYLKYRGRNGVAFIPCRQLGRWAQQRGDEKRAVASSQERALQAGLRLVDDFGTEAVNRGWELDVFLSQCESEGLPTIITMNTGALDGIDGRLASRLLGHGTRHVLVKGPDMRLSEVLTDVRTKKGDHRG